MANETQQSSSAEPKQMSFGARLKSTRESKGLDRKDTAAQLRLTEKTIAMMEYERYPADMPVTFIKGYLRAYGKLLQIPEHEVNKALAPIKPKPILPSSISNKSSSLPVTSGNYFMQVFTYLIVFTIIGLVGSWWYTHSNSTSSVVAENQATVLPENTNPVINQPVVSAAPIAPVAAPVAANPFDNNATAGGTYANNPSITKEATNHSAIANTNRENATNAIGNGNNSSGITQSADNRSAPPPLADNIKPGPLAAQNSQEEDNTTTESETKTNDDKTE